MGIVRLIQKFEKRDMKIIYKELNNSKEIEVFLSFEKTVNDLINIYFKMKGIIRDKNKIFLCNNKENIGLNEKKKIKDFLNKDLKESILNISVFENGYIKAIFNHDYDKFIYISLKKKCLI